MIKTYAVTGVASGIGASIAAQLKQGGHRVVGFDVKPVALNVDQFIQLDLNDTLQIENAADTVNEELDGLCNNAGLPPREGLEKTILQVNFLGQRQFTAAVMQRIKPGGSIVNMASRAGAAWQQNIEQVLRLGAITDSAALDAFIKLEEINATRCYNLSKEAMIGWSLSMVEELLQRDIRINTISPGAIATGILDDFAQAFGEKMARNIKRAGRAGSPEEVANIAVFMLSSESGWLKGVDIPVDGGMGAFNLADALGLHELNQN